MKKTVGNMFLTDDYDKFMFIKGNRKVRSGHVRALEESMKKFGYIQSEPIKVKPRGNGKYEIGDGQHRFCAARNLGIPFTFITNDDLTLDLISESNRNHQGWDTIDYVHRFASEGDKSYIWFQDMHNKYHLPNMAMIMVAFRDNTYGGQSNKRVKDGKLKLTPREMSIAEAELEFLSKHVGFVHAMGGSRQNVYSALLFAYRNNKCDSDRLSEKLLKNQNSFEPCATTAQYLKEFSKLYNRRLRNDSDVEPIYLHHDWEALTGRAV